MATSSREEPAWLLHSTPYRETSLVVDLFTREHGRIAAVAKGAKRPRSSLRAVLLQFQPLRVSWTGRRELRTLTGAEWSGGLDAPRGDALLCAFYLNELLMRLLAREDPHPLLFDAYGEALGQLGAQPSLDETLRRFEWTLLREIGYAPDLERDADMKARFGYSTVRFTNEDVMRNMDGVLTALQEALDAQPDRWPGCAGTTPQPPPLKRRGSRKHASEVSPLSEKEGEGWPGLARCLLSLAAGHGRLVGRS